MVPWGSLRTPQDKGVTLWGRGVTPWGRGQQWGLIQVGGAGVKAINTLILSSFLCCPKLLMAPKASLGTAHSGREVWDLGTCTQEGPTPLGVPELWSHTGCRG